MILTRNKQILKAGLIIHPSTLMGRQRMITWGSNLLLRNVSGLPIWPKEKGLMEGK